MPGNEGRFSAADTGNASIAQFLANERAQVGERASGNLMERFGRLKANALA